VYADSVLNINKDFSKVNNFAFWVYVDNADNVGYIGMYLTSDTSGDFDNKFLYGKIYNVRTGWNKIVLNRNNFQSFFGESWDNVMRFLKLEVGPSYGSTDSFNATLDDLRNNLTGNRAKIIITFDDGLKSDYSTAYPILKANNQSAVSYVVTSRVGDSALANLADLRELQSAGWDISSHTVSHSPDLLASDDPTRISELNNSYDWLVANKFQKSAGFLSYPNGAFDSDVIDKTQKRYTLARSIDRQGAQQHYTKEDIAIQYIQRVTEAYGLSLNGNLFTPPEELINHINDTINAKLLGILLFHGIVDSPTSDVEYSTANFTKLSNYLKNRRSDVDVITLSDYVIPNIRAFTPVINKTTRMYSNGTSVIITNNKYDEYMPNMTVEPSSGSIDIGITIYNEMGGLIKFNENSSNSNVQVTYAIGDRIPNNNYSVKIFWGNGTKYQDFNIIANSTGYINYISTGFGNPRYQEIEAPPGSTVKGTVKNNTSNAPISGATVTAGTRSATTDTNGNYIIYNISAGNYSVTASASGYLSLTKQNINVEENQITTVNFTLSPDSSLKAYWKFDENTGTTASDSSGNGNNGTLSLSGATWTAGKIGNALSFDGINGYVNTGNGASLNINGNQITIEAWVYTKSLSENYIISKFDGDTVTSGYNLLLTSSNIYFRLGSGTTGYQFVTAHGMSTNNWYHLVAVYDGTSMKIYKNGTVLSGSTSFSGTIGTNSLNVNIGQRVDDSYRWNGYIDDFRIYNRALSASEILADAG